MLRCEADTCVSKEITKFMSEEKQLSFTACLNWRLFNI